MLRISPRRSSGMTLVEILIVAMVLLILAMVTAPHLARATQDARESALCADCTSAQRQIDRYRLEHGGLGPECDEDGETDFANFVLRLTTPTDRSGKLNASGAYGPYLPQWPENPFCDESIADKVVVGKTSVSPRSGSSGWHFCTVTGKLYPNSVIGGESLDP
jgi:type II secretory pathway pseudopilin PulG